MENMHFGDLGGITQEGSGFHRHDTPARNATESDSISQDYNDLTEGGVEHAIEVARTDILETINNAPDGAVLFIGGRSDQIRTGQTGEIWGEALSELPDESKENLLVITKKEIDNMHELSKENHDGSKVIDEINHLISENPDKKIIIDYPLFIKQLGYGYEDRWTQKNQEGKIEKTPYFSEILKKHHNNHAEAIHDWLQNDGTLELEDGRLLQGPRPETVAKQYLYGLERLYHFAKDKIPTSRPVLVHAIGHQWDLDAVATYLAKGKVNYEAWEEVMGRPDADKEEQVINEGEAVQNIIIDPQSGSMSVEYRGNKFNYEVHT